MVWKRFLARIVGDVLPDGDRICRDAVSPSTHQGVNALGTRVSKSKMLTHSGAMRTRPMG